MRPSPRKSLILSFPLLIGALIAAGALTGCGPERVSSTPPTPPTVSYNVTGNTLTQANARAASYCQSYGAPARLLSVQNGVATYTCSTAAAAAPPPAYSQPTYSTPPVTSPMSPAPIQ